MTDQKKGGWLSRLPELIYPRRCPLCDRLLRDSEPYVCRDCSRKMQVIRGPVCMKCGRPLSADTAEYCDNCRRTGHVYDQGFAPFAYGGMIQNSLMRFKYGNRAEYARFYARVTSVCGRTYFAKWRPQMIVPVPLHPSRYMKRGYNQAAVYGEELSKLLEIPLAEHSVCRTRNTRPQKGLEPGERRSNLRGAFAVCPGSTFPPRVLIVDDIYTTGTTIDELAGVLRAAGVSRIYFACVSIAEGDT